MIILIQGTLNTLAFESACVDGRIEPNQTIFLFPGNPSHHQSEVNLMTIKSGSGLATVAYHLGRAGYPTWSLPTVSVEHDSPVVEDAINKLKAFIDEGYHLMIPVRLHQNQQFFPQRLSIPNDTSLQLEPSFWGGIARNSNLELASLYIDTLNEVLSKPDQVITLSAKEEAEDEECHLRCTTM